MTLPGADAGAGGFMASANEHDAMHEARTRPTRRNKVYEGLPQSCLRFVECMEFE